MADEALELARLAAFMAMPLGNLSTAHRAITRWEPWEYLSLILQGGRQLERAMAASSALWKAVAREPA